ncbi:type II secretion system F family protein [Pyrodictium delaneyi]|uniref:Type II secretion system protein GspF domain-containing protein n=1 Tax=Pyrodictium delaneyi TaxID=1273541 RepID=A0A211YRS6_9CREN|nr:type II secretion system F family protein [Pyrodictium delaneyi]OWJ55710.1 hypothetical protein Pdsh_02730 [Pyrodictium delaneyi]
MAIFRRRGARTGAANKKGKEKSERNGKVSTRLSLTLLYDSLAIATFGKYAEKFARSFELNEAISKAGMAVHPWLYAARLLFGILLLSLTLGSLAIFVALLDVSLIIKIVIALMAFMIPLVVFALGLYYPHSKAAARAMAVDNEFPFFAAYLTAMAYGGVPPEKVIERLAEIKVFKAMRDEAIRILRDVKMFGSDILTALERNAARHPSRMYRDFMLGYLTTLRTGGDIIHYLEIRTQELFQARMEDLKSRAERVGLIVEAYAAVAIMGTLSLYIFFIVAGLIGGGGMAGTTGIIIYSLVILPLVTVAVIAMLNSLLPSQENIREPYAYLLVTVPLGVFITLAFLALSGGTAALRGEANVNDIVKLVTAVGLGFIVASIGPAVAYMKQVRRERKISRALSSFFRDLSEVRRTGLSPEKSIIVLAERDYGELSNIVKRIAGALAAGLHVEKAVRRAIRGYRNWLLRVTMRFLVDAIDVGGGSPTTVDSLARFISTLIEIHESMRKRLKPYIMMPYFGAIMVAVTGILTLSMMVQAVVSAGLGGATGRLGGLSVNISPENINKLLVTASVASIINAWLSGLVAGKIQDQSLAAGFLHATILTTITLLSVILSLILSSSMLASL